MDPSPSQPLKDRHINSQEWSPTYSTPAHHSPQIPPHGSLDSPPPTSCTGSQVLGRRIPEGPRLEAASTFPSTCLPATRSKMTRPHTQTQSPWWVLRALALSVLSAPRDQPMFTTSPPHPFFSPRPSWACPPFLPASWVRKFGVQCLYSLCCCHKVMPVGGFKRQKCFPLHFWRWESELKVSGGLRSLWRLEERVPPHLTSSWRLLPFPGLQMHPSNLCPSLHVATCRGPLCPPLVL